MPHLYAKARNAGRQKAAKYSKGGSIFDAGVSNVASGTAGVIGGRAARANARDEALKAEGAPKKARLDKRARGGFMGMPKRKGIRAPKPKLGHTHINIMVAPTSGAPDANTDLMGAPAPVGAPPLMPKGPMVPPGVMGPPPGGLMGGGEPGIPGTGPGSKLPIPGMPMRRGGKVKR